MQAKHSISSQKHHPKSVRRQLHIPVFVVAVGTVPDEPPAHRRPACMKTAPLRVIAYFHIYVQIYRTDFGFQYHLRPVKAAARPLARLLWSHLCGRVSLPGVCGNQGCQVGVVEKVT